MISPRGNIDLREKFYTWLNRERPGKSLRPLQKVLVYTYLQMTDESERTDILDLIDDYEDFLNGETPKRRG